MWGQRTPPTATQLWWLNSAPPSPKTRLHLPASRANCQRAVAWGGEPRRCASISSLHGGQRRKWPSGLLPRALAPIPASQGTHGRPAQGQVLWGQTQAHWQQVSTWRGFKEGSRGSGQVRESPLAEATSWAAVAGGGKLGLAAVRQAQNTGREGRKHGPRNAEAAHPVCTCPPFAPDTISARRGTTCREVQGPAKATRSPRHPTAQPGPWDHAGSWWNRQAPFTLLSLDDCPVDAVCFPGLPEPDTG